MNRSRLLPGLVACLVLFLIVAYVAYDVLYLGFDFDYRYYGKTIDTSQLYGDSNFSWYEYNVSHDYLGGEPSIAELYRFDYGDRPYNGSPAKYYRETVKKLGAAGGNYTHILDIYWDASGAHWLDTTYEDIRNGELIGQGRLNASSAGTYQKRLPVLPLDQPIAVKGRERITVFNRSYDCDKYYMPDYIDHVSASGTRYAVGSRITYWFDSTIPVPVKIEFPYNVTYELTGWG